jgi:hypothetical protein
MVLVEVLVVVLPVGAQPGQEHPVKGSQVELVVKQLRPMLSAGAVVQEALVIQIRGQMLEQVVLDSHLL